MCVESVIIANTPSTLLNATKEQSLRSRKTKAASYKIKIKVYLQHWLNQEMLLMLQAFYHTVTRLNSTIFQGLSPQLHGEKSSTSKEIPLYIQDLAWRIPQVILYNTHYQTFLAMNPINSIILLITFSITG